MRRFRLSMSFLLILVFPAVTFAANFSFDLDWIEYSDSQINYSLDFSTGTIQNDPYGPYIEIPSMPQIFGLSLPSDRLDDISLDTTNDVLKLGIPQPDASNPTDYYHVAVGGNVPNNLPVEWTYAASIKNFTNTSILDETYYGALMFSGRAPTTVPNLIQTQVQSWWFTGNRNGVEYEDALMLRARILGPYQWWSDFNIITGLDPLSTSLDMKIDVTNNGQTFLSYFRLNGDTDWEQLSDHTLPEGLTPIYGFGSNGSLQGIASTTQLISSSPVPVPTTVLLLGTGLIGLAGARRKFRK